MPWHSLKSSARWNKQNAKCRILVFFQQGGKTKPLAKTRGTCVDFVVQLTANASICFEILAVGLLRLVCFNAVAQFEK